MDEVAHRLVERGILANPSDVTYALFDEVESALLAEEPSSDLQQRISRRSRSAQPLRLCGGTGGITGLRRTASKELARAQG